MLSAAKGHHWRHARMSLECDKMQADLYYEGGMCIPYRPVKLAQRMVAVEHAWDLKDGLGQV